MVGKWYVSDDEELYNLGPFDSRAEAAIAAVEELDIEPGQRFWVGVAVPAACGLSARNVVRMLDDYAADNAPYNADGYNVSGKAMEELDQLLDAWAKKHNVVPTWYSIEQVSEHVMPEQPK